MHDDNNREIDDLEIIEENPRRKDGVPETAGLGVPEVGKVVLGIAIGCFSLVALASVAVFLGFGLLRDALNNQGQPGAVSQGQNDNTGEVVDFKPGDPLPDPPLQLPVPPAPASRVGETDLTEVDPPALYRGARQFFARRNYPAAIQCQYMTVRKTNTGQYDLACYYSLARDIDAALYWLQVGAREEGSNADWACRDSDLVNVRSDARWPKVLTYLHVYQRYWETSGFSETSLVLPRDATPERPLPVFIGLHGMGTNAHSFVDATEYQPLADKMGVAFLGVSGTRPTGKQSFVWSEDPVKDLARIDDALRETADRLTPAEGQVVLFGFSQGAWMAAEIAQRHPDRFAGAIVLSPGTVADLQFAAVEATPAHRRQKIVAVCGAEEQPGNIYKTKECATAFEKLGARVYQKLYPGMNTHSFPPDYWQRLPIWGRFILDPDAPLPPQ
jgi:predicted esterase